MDGDHGQQASAKKRKKLSFGPCFRDGRTVGLRKPRI